MTAETGLYLAALLYVVTLSAFNSAYSVRIFVQLRCREFELTIVARVMRVRLVQGSQCEVGLQIVVAPPDQRALLDRLFP